MAISLRIKKQEMNFYYELSEIYVRLKVLVYWYKDHHKSTGQECTTLLSEGRQHGVIISLQLRKP